MKTKLHLWRPAWASKISVLIQGGGTHNDDQWIGHVQPLRLQDFKLMTPETDGEVIPETCTIDNDEAQRLMNQLWDLGVRPSEGSGSAGAMAAVEKHLQDLRTITYHALKIKL